MGFVSNHEERDLELPKSRKKLMDAIEGDLLNDKNILAFFYGESIGKQNTDLYSDIDFRLVIKPEKIEEYISNKNQLPQNWGNVLYFEDANPFSNYIVVHYECFIKVDTFYYKLDDDISPLSLFKKHKNHERSRWNDRWYFKKVTGFNLQTFA